MLAVPQEEEEEEEEEEETSEGGEDAAEEKAVLEVGGLRHLSEEKAAEAMLCFDWHVLSEVCYP